MATEVERSEPKLFAGPFHGHVPRIIGIMARAHGVIEEKIQGCRLCGTFAGTVELWFVPEGEKNGF